MNPYMQYFCGQAHFRHCFPCDLSDFAHFRKRIGEEGVSMIFKHSVSIHGKQDNGKMEISDTTVQENNITGRRSAFPTDAKPAKKIIDTCNAIAKKFGVAQRQTYCRTSKQSVRDTYKAKHPKRRKKAQKAIRKLKTLAGRQLRELRAKLGNGFDALLDKELGLYGRVLAQTRTSSNKIYSLHKPFTAYIAKGKGP